jgi:hypothetical protein
MVRKSFTLIETIFVIVILGLIVVGGAKIISKLFERNYLVKKTSEFEFVTQNILDKTSNILYYRIPLSVIGYNPTTHDFKYIGDITQNDENYSVLEWIGELSEVKRDLNFSGFADLARSNNPILYAMDFNSSFIDDVLRGKYNESDTNLSKRAAIIFAGAFDEGDEAVKSDYNNSFGWHGHRADYVFRIANYNQNGNNCELNLTNYDGSEIVNKRIYAKFYLVDSAYALAIKRDLNDSNWNCSNLALSDVKENDLLLFYDYQPWENNETFCADNNGTPAGKVTILAENVKAFLVRKVNSHLELRIELNEKKGDINISVSKQKVAF